MPDIKHRVLIQARADMHTSVTEHSAAFISEQLRAVADELQFGNVPTEQYESKYQFARALLLGASACELPESSFIPELSYYDHDISSITLTREQLNKLISVIDDTGKITITDLKLCGFNDQKLQIIIEG